MGKNKLSKFVRIDLKDFVPYKPVAPASVIAGAKLDANENGYGPTIKVYDALSNYKGYQYYPDPNYLKLRKTIAGYTGVGIENVFVGNGGDEIIDLFLRLVIEPGDEIINCPPTFSSYAIYSKLNRAKVVNIDRRDDYSIDKKKVIEKINKKTKAVFLCNPNNPTGTVIDEKDIIDILKTGIMVFLDEAYFEFYCKTCSDLLKPFPNLVILRSFSKWSGLAGLRLGYLMADKYIVDKLMMIKSPYNVNSAAVIAGLEALKDRKYREKNISEIIKERDRMTKIISTNYGIARSYGNFIYVKCSENGIKDLKSQFIKNSIFVRYFPNGIRITIGKRKQNDAVIKILNGL